MKPVLVLALLTLLMPAPVSAQPSSSASPSVPVGLRIPSLGLEAPIVPLGLADDGNMAAPTDPDTIGWYAPGARVGVPGNAILDGHVDWGGRLRVFGLLKQLGPGDTVEVADEAGDWLEYQVVWSQLVDAADPPLHEIFSQGPEEEVTLITCGGTFDSGRHAYLGRLVVRAVRASADRVSAATGG